MRIDVVDPRHYTKEASGILRAAWSPPCLRYAPEDLQWQFERPSWGPPWGLLAVQEGGIPIGFVAAMPRRVRFQGRIIEVYLSSYFSVKPEPGRGPVAPALIRSEVRLLRSFDRPFLGFAEPGSIGEKMSRAIAAMGLIRLELGVYPVYGGQPRDGNAPLKAREIVDSDLDTVLDLAARCDDSQIIRDHPDRAQLEHERRDPRGRCLVLVEDATESPVAAAAVYRSEMIGLHGPESIATIGVLYAPEPSPEVLRTVLAFTARRWAGSVSALPVILPNAAGLDAGLLRAAGMRKTQAAWAGHVCFKNKNDQLIFSNSTNLEII